MTIAPLLPELDLASYAPLPPDQKRKALVGFKSIWPPYSYKPVRRSLCDLLNLDTGLFGSAERTPLDRILHVIRENSKHPDEATANMRVAAALYELGWSGRQQPFGTMGTTIGQALTYWTPAVLALDGRPVVPFFNPRRSHLSPAARRFIFSMMHEHIRAADDDYASVSFCICHFTAPKTGPRAARPVFDTGVMLYSFDELQAMIAETYAIWAEVWADREEEARRRGGGPGWF